MSARSFNVYLSTMVTSPGTNNIVPISKTNPANVTWNIDWDNLFRGINYKYNRCTVRCALQSASWVAAATDWDDRSGYLVTNMASQFGSTTNNGTQLMLIYPIDAPTTGTTTHCYLNSTMEQACGVDILVPRGVQQVSFSMYNDDALSLMTAFPDYQLRLLFELSEPIAVA